MSTIAQLERLALLYEEQGDYVNARELFKKTLAYKETKYGPRYDELATDLYNLGLLYFATDQPQEAERLLIRALTIEEKTLGPEHPNVLDTLHVLQALYHESSTQLDSPRFDKLADKPNSFNLAYA